MSTTTPLAAGYVRARRSVPVLVDQPMSNRLPNRRFRGKLLGAMWARGSVHHFRIEGDDGRLYLAPPTWIVGPPPILVPAATMEVVL